MQCRSQNQMGVRWRQFLSISPCRVFQWCPSSHTLIYPAKHLLLLLFYAALVPVVLWGDVHVLGHSGLLAALGQTASFLLAQNSGLPYPTLWMKCLWRREQHACQQEHKTEEGVGSSFLTALPLLLFSLLAGIWTFKSGMKNERNFLPLPPIKVCRAIDLKTSWAVWHTDSLNHSIINVYYEGCIAPSFPAASLRPFENVWNPSFLANIHWEPLKLNLSDVRSLIL